MQKIKSKRVKIRGKEFKSYSISPAMRIAAFRRISPRGLYFRMRKIKGMSYKGMFILQSKESNLYYVYCGFMNGDSLLTLKCQFLDRALTEYKNFNSSKLAVFRLGGY